jgi:hypothetical protein
MLGIALIFLLLTPAYHMQALKCLDAFALRNFRD